MTIASRGVSSAFAEVSTPADVVLARSRAALSPSASRVIGCEVVVWTMPVTAVAELAAGPIAPSPTLAPSTAPFLIFSAVTAFALIFSALTELALSCFLPTLFAAKAGARRRGRGIRRATTSRWRT